MPHDPLLHFTGQDVASLLKDRARRFPGRDFMIWEPLEGKGRTWSYAAFLNEARAIAAGLIQRGVKPGDKVIIHSENCPEFVLSLFALTLCGGVAVTTNIRSSGHDLGYFAEKSKAVGAICSIAHAGLLAESAPGLSWIIAIDPDGSGGGFDRFETLMADPSGVPERAPDPMGDFVVQFTSGTTSRPKGVVLSHANALWGGSLGAMHESLMQDDTYLIHLPLFHVNALLYSLFPILWVGGRFVLMPRFSASRFWPVSLAHRCTWTSMVPFCVRALLSQPVPDAHHYRLWGNAISAPPMDALFRVKTIGWWGMTETVTHGIVASPFEDNIPLGIGRPSPGYAIYVLKDDGTPVEPGETGSLLISGVPGVSLFKGYLDDPEATRAAFDEQGRFITGDRITMAQDGSLMFGGRDKEMLKVGGENVATAEIERIIHMVPGVQEAAVIGVPHPMLDEVPIAIVIPIGASSDELAEAILAQCKMVLADFKVPRFIRFVEEMPCAALNKIAKGQLRDLILSEMSAK